MPASRIALCGADLEMWEGGDGPPLLFLHGAGGFSAGHDYVGLLGRHRRVIAPSHPGFGKSALPDWLDSVDDIAHIYLELMAAPRPCPARSDRLLDRRLDRRRARQQGAGTVPPLVMVGPVGVKLARRDKLDVPDMFAIPPEQLDELLFHDPDRHRPDISKLSERQIAIMLRNRETLALIAWEPYMHNPKLKHRLQRIGCPALFLRGDSDGLVSAEYLEGYAKLLPNARCMTIPQAGHAPQLEQPPPLPTQVLSFLNG